jgi:hypothetical protein
MFLKLENLYLDDTNVDDGGLMPLNGLKALKRLDLRGTPISDTGLAVLSEMPSLRQLDLSNTAISDQGLLVLAELDLESVALQETATTPEGRRQVHNFRVSLTPALPWRSQ